MVVNVREDVIYCSSYGIEMTLMSIVDGGILHAWDEWNHFERARVPEQPRRSPQNRLMRAHVPVYSVLLRLAEPDEDLDEQWSIARVQFSRWITMRRVARLCDMTGFDWSNR
jgi:hypothetical protein